MFIDENVDERNSKTIKANSNLNGKTLTSVFFIIPSSANSRQLGVSRAFLKATGGNILSVLDYNFDRNSNATTGQPWRQKQRVWCATRTPDEVSQDIRTDKGIQAPASHPNEIGLSYKNNLCFPDNTYFKSGLIRPYLCPVKG